MGSLIRVPSGFFDGCEDCISPRLYELRFTKRTRELETERGFPTGEMRPWILMDAWLSRCHGLKFVCTNPSSPECSHTGERIFKEVIILKEVVRLDPDSMSLVSL